MMRKLHLITIFLAYSIVCNAQKFQVNIYGGTNALIIDKSLHKGTFQFTSPKFEIKSVLGGNISFIPGRVKITLDLSRINMNSFYVYDLGQYAIVPSLRCDYRVRVRNSNMEFGLQGGRFHTSQSYYERPIKMENTFLNRGVLFGVNIGYSRPVTDHILVNANIQLLHLYYEQERRGLYSDNISYNQNICIATVGVGYEIGKLKTRTRYNKVSNVADEISKLDDLRARGIITEEEFQKRKQYLLEHP